MKVGKPFRPLWQSGMVSVPLRGSSDESSNLLKDRQLLLSEMKFQSPCGEVVMKG